MNSLLTLLLATALFSLAAAHAADQPVNQIPATKPSGHLVLNGGLTYGGDTLYTVTYTNGDTTDIKGGGFYQIGVGGLYQFESQPFSIKLSAYLHYDVVTGRNGDVFFYRLPVETLAYYTGIAKLRIGGGIRMVNSPEISATINGATEKVSFENATGLIAEVGYQVAPRAWLNARAVSEKYQGKSLTSGGATTSLAGTATKSGSHLGVNFSYEL